MYGNDKSEDSYAAAIALVDKYPDLEVIMAPTTVGIAAAAKAMQDEGLCEDIAVSGLGLPSEMVDFTHERLRARVRAVVVRGPRLPDLLRELPARHRRHRGCRG